MVNQIVYSVVIFSHRYLDRDLINDKTFFIPGGLIVHPNIIIQQYNTDIKDNNSLNRASTMLNNVFKLKKISDMQSGYTG